MAEGLDRLLRLRLKATLGGSENEIGGTAFFLVVVDNGSPEEAKAWLADLVRDKGRVVAVEELDPGPETEPKPAPASSGVGPEEKTLLWGKP
jgi:hypothetical protein